MDSKAEKNLVKIGFRRNIFFHLKASEIWPKRNRKKRLELKNVQYHVEFYGTMEEKKYKVISLIDVSGMILFGRSKFEIEK